MDNNEVHPHTRAACQAARAQGHVVVIATGRALVRARPLLAKLADVDYLVCNNGALVYDLQRQRPLHLEGVNPLHYLSIVDFARQHRLSFKLHTDQDWIGDVGIEDQQPTPLTPALDQQIRAHIYKHPGARQLFNGQTPTQLSIHGSKQFCQAQLARFRAWFGADSNVVIANDVYLDVNPRHTSKWSGLMVLARQLAIPADQIVTFGDSTNDLEMLVGAGVHGYALANSKAALAAVVPPRIGDNNSAAIGETIFRYLHLNKH